MDVAKMATVLPVADMDRAVAAWTGLLGAEPAIRDGDAWAQFDVAGHRIALAGSDRISETAGMMIKVDSIDEAIARIDAAGWHRRPASKGRHEVRVVATTPEGVAVAFYAALA